jgi:hypothetical protein
MLSFLSKNDANKILQTTEGLPAANYQGLFRLWGGLANGWCD